MSGKLSYLWFTLNSAFEEMILGYSWWLLLFYLKECIETEVLYIVLPNTEHDWRSGCVSYPLRLVSVTEYEMERQVSEFNIMGLCMCRICVRFLLKNLLEKNTQQKYNTKNLKVVYLTELSDIPIFK